MPKLDSPIGGVNAEGPGFAGRADGLAGREAFVELEGGGGVRACDVTPAGRRLSAAAKDKDDGDVAMAATIRRSSALVEGFMIP